MTWPELEPTTYRLPLSHPDAEGQSVYVVVRMLSTVNLSGHCNNDNEHYSGTPFERPPWREATPSGKATFLVQKGMAPQEGFHCIYETAL